MPKKVKLKYDDTQVDKNQPEVVESKKRDYNWPDPAKCGNGDSAKSARLLHNTLVVFSKVIQDCTHDICGAIMKRN